MTETSGGELRLPPQPWMSTPATMAVIAALTAGGSEVRFVGGCVRDAMLGRAVTDIDIATPDEPTRVIELLEAAGLKAVPTGIDHGTVTAVAQHQPFEITTLRRDVETDGRRAMVAFTDDWIEDAARRDFTFNAMSCRRTGGCTIPSAGPPISPPSACASSAMPRPASARMCCACCASSASTPITAPRRPTREALAAVERLAPLLPSLSGERIAAETLKLLAARDPAAVLRLMQGHGVLAHFLPESVHLDRLARLTAIERSLSLKPEPPRRLAAVLESEAAARAVAATLASLQFAARSPRRGADPAGTDARPRRKGPPRPALRADGGSLPRP